MKWISNGWFVGARKQADYYICSVLSEKHGLWKGGYSRSPPLLGSYIKACWHGKDVSSLGTFQIEVLDVKISNLAITDLKKSRFLMGMCEAMNHWCNEREPHMYGIFTDSIPMLYNPSLENMQSFLKLILKENWGYRGNIKQAPEELGIKNLQIYQN